MLARLADELLEATVALSFSRAGYAARSRLWSWERPPARVLAGRTAVVTGAASGLGLATARALSDLGARVWLVGRTAERLDRARRSIVDGGGPTRAEVVTWAADLAEPPDVAKLIDTLAAEEPAIDVLVHNAGALSAERQVNSLGFEMTVAAQLVGPFQLTRGLLPLLRAAESSRVITVSSGGMYTERLDVDDLVMGPDEYRGTVAYARVKRAQVALTREWARHEPGIAFHAMHPGWAATPGLTESLPAFSRLMKPLLRTPDQGADTIVWLATSNEPLCSTGHFWLDRRRRSTVRLPWTRAEPGEDRRLWEAVTTWAEEGR